MPNPTIVYLARAILRHPDRDEEILGVFPSDAEASAACEMHASETFWGPNRGLNRVHYDYRSDEVSFWGELPPGALGGEENE